MSVLTKTGKVSDMFVNHNGIAKAVRSGWVNHNGVAVPVFRKGGAGSVYRVKWKPHGYYNAATRATTNRIILNPSEIKKITLSGRIRANASSSSSTTSETCYLRLYGTLPTGSTSNINNIASVTYKGSVVTTLLDYIVIDVDNDINWSNYDRSKPIYLDYGLSNTYSENDADIDIEIETVLPRELNIGFKFMGQGYSSTRPYSELIVLDAETLKAVQVTGTATTTLYVRGVKIGNTSFITASSIPYGKISASGTMLEIPDWSVYDVEYGVSFYVGSGTSNTSANLDFYLKW